jgi:hypothetical protein
VRKRRKIANKVLSLKLVSAAHLSHHPPKKIKKRFGAKTENRGAPAAATKPIRRGFSFSLSLTLYMTRLHNVLKCKNKVLQRRTSIKLPRTPYLSDHPRDVSPNLTSKNPLSSKISQHTKKKTNKFTDYFSPTNFQSPTFKLIARAWDTDKIKIAMDVRNTDASLELIPPSMYNGCWVRGSSKLYNCRIKRAGSRAASRSSNTSENFKKHLKLRFSELDA